MKKIFLIAFALLTLFSACEKSVPLLAKSQTDDQSSQLIIDWTDVQFRLIKNTTGVTHVAYSRHFSYTGLAIYEALVNGDNKKLSIAPLLNGTINLPAPHTTNRVFFPVSANAAFASMFRYFYASKQSNLLVIDSLENVYKTKYENEARENYDIEKSIQYGKEIAAAVIELSKQDGSSNANIPYIVQTEGGWEPTAPAYAAAAVPGWGNNRTLIPGSTANAMPPAPLAFSKDAGTPFYNMVKELYEVSQSLTEEQKSIANFWDDAPNGKYLTAFGHWFSILKQVLQKENTSLMKAADAYLRLGITLNDASIICWKSKYSYHQLRPITYIRKYMGHETWNPFITTPPHPEYLAAHATLSSAAAYALESVFGENYSFSDHTYESLGMPVRNYNSLEDAGTEAGISRLYGGIHYRPSIDAGKTCGIKVGENVKNILRTDK